VARGHGPRRNNHILAVSTWGDLSPRLTLQGSHTLIDQNKANNSYNAHRSFRLEVAVFNPGGCLLGHRSDTLQLDLSFLKIVQAKQAFRTNALYLSALTAWPWRSIGHAGICLEMPSFSHPFSRLSAKSLPRRAILTRTA